jgi:hypothetical protein
MSSDDHEEMLNLLTQYTQPRYDLLDKKEDGPNVIPDDGARLAQIFEKHELLNPQAGGGSEEVSQKGGDAMTAKEIEEIVFLIIEYRRIILPYDLRKNKNIKLYIDIVIENESTKGIVSVPSNIFQRKAPIRSFQKPAQYASPTMSVGHKYMVDREKLKAWLGPEEDSAKKKKYPFLAKLNATPEGKTAFITNAPFKNNRIEHEIAWNKKDIFHDSKRLQSFKDLLKTDTTRWDQFIVHKDTFLKVSNIDNVYDSIRFSPKQRGYIINGIKHLMVSLIGGNPSIGSVIPNQTFGVFTKKGDNTFGTKPVFSEGDEKAEEALKLLDGSINELSNMDVLDSENMDFLEKVVENLAGKNLWFNLTIPGNHTWVLFYMIETGKDKTNGKFYSLGGGYNNQEENKLTYYSPDPVYAYDQHYLFPLLLNSWGLVDAKVCATLTGMARKIDKKTASGHELTTGKYSLFTNRLSAYCFNRHNCASVADEILGHLTPLVYAHPDFFRGSTYTYDSVIFEKLITYVDNLSKSSTSN